MNMMKNIGLTVKTMFLNTLNNKNILEIPAIEVIPHTNKEVTRVNQTIPDMWVINDKIVWNIMSVCYDSHSKGKS